MPSADAGTYVGDELDVFRLARNWKRYWAGRLGPWVRGRVLEVGAGIGSSTRAACTGREDAWLCLEPDSALAARILAEHDRAPFPLEPEVRVGGLEALRPGEAFDCTLYIDVLEHIDDDRGELARVAPFVRPGGALVVLAPAHQRLYSPFDRSIGHFRRYDAEMLAALAPPDLRLDRTFYLDSAGLLLSWINRHIRRGGTPGGTSILAWDRLFIPISRLVDPLHGFRWGKTVVAVWTRPCT